jgi:hypothetical protein
MRDPRTNPEEGDTLRQLDGTREVLVDRVANGDVFFRVTDGRGGLIAARRMAMVDWRAAAGVGS